MMPRLLLIAAIALVGACAEAPLAVVPAPDFVLTDLSGKTVRLSDFRGHPVLVDFWATWCDPCRASIPVYAKLFKDRGGSGFAIVGIDEDDAKVDVAAFAAKNSIPYPLLRDPERSTFAAFGASGLPSAFLIDAEGKIVRRWDGFDSGTAYDVEGAIDALQPKK